VNGVVQTLRAGIDFAGPGWAITQEADRHVVALDLAAISSGAASPLRGAYAVAKNGNDETGNGAWSAPFATVSAGFAQIVTARATITAGVLLIAPGSYALEDPLVVDFGEEPYSTRPTTFRALGGRGSVVLPQLSFTDSATELTVWGCTITLAEGEGAGLLTLHDSSLSNMTAESIGVVADDSELNNVVCSLLTAKGCTLLGSLTCTTATLRDCDLSGLAEITGDVVLDAATLGTNPTITISGTTTVLEDARYTPTP
jgi:hypothetical protein